MAMKVPCVSSNVGAVEEIIDDGETGLLFSPGDLETLVTHLRTLLQDESKRRQIGEAGYRKVVTELNSARMAEEHRQFYDRVLASASSARSKADLRINLAQL
jgi:glycosyltransferase involved in cell wall biosynthesis